jgi:2-oxoglutarate dehydrogenase E2 component (dihydrolipoamide succinyltransferase)
MSLSLKVPALGESVREATLGTWKHKEGDHVEADEPLVEVESEKATLEVPSPGAGVLKKILRKAGETVAVGEVIAEIETGAGAVVAPVSDGNGRGSAPVPVVASDAGGELRAGPAARRALADSGLTGADVKGTGRGGRVSNQDVARALELRDPALAATAHAAAP